MGEPAADRREDYAERKRLGLCARCKDTMDRPGAYCSKCTGGHGVSKHREDWRRAKMDQGLCHRCGKRNRRFKPDGSLAQDCALCGRKVRSRNAQRYRRARPAAVKTKVQRCGLCGQSGHNRRGCSAGGFRLDVVEYASRRETA